MNPNYYAVIPAHVRYSNVTPAAKLLYGEITALTSKEGFCWASNQYFADLYDVNINTISLWISQLKDAGFIKTFVDRKNGNTRKIWLNLTQKNVIGIHNNVDTYHEKAEQINTINNTINNIAETKVSEDDFQIVPDLEEEKNTKSKDPRERVAREAMRENLLTLAKLRGLAYTTTSLNLDLKIYTRLWKDGWSIHTLAEEYTNIINEPFWKEEKQKGNYPGMNTVQFRVKNKKPV